MKRFKLLFMLVIALMWREYSYADNFTVASVEGKLIEYTTEYSSSVIVAASSAVNQSIEGALTIPDVVEYNGKQYDVTKIGAQAFKGNTKLTSVTIGEKVTNVNESAFYGCTNLATVSLGTSLARIDKYGFYQCSSLTNVAFPDNLKSFGQSAFCSSGLTCDVVLPSSLLTIEEQAFAWTGITSVRFNSNVTIKAGAFNQCSSITAYYFSPTVLQPTMNYSSSYGSTLTINAGTKIYVSQATLSMLENNWFQSGHTLQSNYNSLPSAFVAYESAEGGVFMNQIDMANSEGVSVGSLALCFTVTSTAEGNATVALYCPPSTGYSANELLKSGANAVIKNGLTADGKLVIPETVTDREGKTYAVTAVGAGAFGEYATNYYSHITGLKFSKTLTHIGVKAFRYLQYLSGNLIIPASVCQIGHPDVARAELFYEENYGELKVPGIYMMHTSASQIDWYETQANHYLAYNYSGTMTALYVCQEIYDKAYGKNGATRYPSTSAFRSWLEGGWNGSNQVKLFNPETYGLTWSTEQTIVDISGEYEAPELQNPFELFVTYSSSNPDVAVINETTGELTLGTAEGSTTLAATFAGNDEYAGPVSVQTVIVRRGEPMPAEDQENHNQWNTCKALTKVARWTPDPILYQEYNMWEMPHMMDGQFYVSAFWQSNNSSEQSESFYWNEITCDYKYLQLSCSPALLSPNYGSEYIAYYNHDEQVGSTLGGFICFKVKGSGTIIVRGFTERDNAKMGICVAGNTPSYFSGTEDREIAYEYTLDENQEAYAYVYGVSLSPNGRHGYIRYIKFVPEGTVMADVSVGGVAIEEESDDVLGDGGSIGFEWREDESGDDGYEGEGVKRMANVKHRLGGDDLEGGDNEGEVGSNRYPVLILNNANLTSENGPAIEVNSHDRFLIELRGQNTINALNGNAAISMGTLQSADWGGGTIRIVGLEESASLTIPAVEGVENGIYLAESSISMEDFTGNISGTGYGIRFQGYDNQDYDNDANCNFTMGAGTSLKMSGGEAALTGFSPNGFNLEYYDEETEEWYENELLYSDIEDASMIWGENGGEYGVEEEVYVEDPDNPEEGYWKTFVTPAKYLFFGVRPSETKISMTTSLTTFCSYYPLNFANVEGMRAYIVTGFKPSESKLVLTKVDEAPARTPLLLYRTGTETEFDIPVEETDMYYGENLLVGCLEGGVTISPVADGYRNYILTYNPNETGDNRSIGFYTFENTRTIPAGKCYLRIPDTSSTSNVKGFKLVFDEQGDIATTIADVDATAATGDVLYDMQGRRTVKPVKGIYIQNGKKVMVK